MAHHHHHHGHHHHAPLSDSALDRRLYWTIVLNVAITIAEFVGGILAGSLAMLSDAAHNLGDSVTIVLALASRKLGRRPPTVRHTYGFKRLEVMGALVNVVLLIGVTVLIGREAILRFFHPTPIAQGIMLVFGFLALSVNVGSLWLLHRHDRRDVNTRGAFLHMVQDAFASVAVIVAALFARSAFGPYLDAGLALLVGLLVMRGAIALAWETLSTMLEGVPSDVDIQKLAEEVDGAFPPARLHHVHVWSLASTHRLLTAHVTLGQELSGSEIETLFTRIKTFLGEHWGISHVTLEPEAVGCPEAALLGHWDCHPHEAEPPARS